MFVDKVCDCAAAATCRSKSTSRTRIISFGNTEIIEIEAVADACRKPDTSHDLTYKHPLDRSMLVPNIEAKVARLKAIAWHEQTCVEYGLSQKIFELYLIPISEPTRPY